MELTEIQLEQIDIMIEHIRENRKNIVRVQEEGELSYITDRLNKTFEITIEYPTQKKKKK